MYIFPSLLFVSRRTSTILRYFYSNSKTFSTTSSAAAGENRKSATTTTRKKYIFDDGGEVGDDNSAEIVVKRMVDRFLIKSSFPDTLLNDLSPFRSLPRVVYAGFDPTSDSLHIGHLLVLNALLHFYAANFQVLIVVGGATGKLGDPSGRSSERRGQSAIDQQSIRANSRAIKSQLERIFLNFQRHFLVTTPPSKNTTNLGQADDEELATKGSLLILDNSEWYSDLNVIDFIREIGPHFRLRHMCDKEMVRSRVEGTKEGMHFGEFSYQIFQAYDWLRLFERYQCRLQIGGSDQLGNIHSGHDLIRRIHQAEAFGLAAPLLTDRRGQKLGKTADSGGTGTGNTGTSVSASAGTGSWWLDPGKTSPFQFYQHFLRLPDSEVEKYLHLFTFLPISDLRTICRKHERNPELRIGQEMLASELTLLVHGPGGLDSARRCTEVLYNSEGSGSGSAAEKISALSEAEFAEIFAQDVVPRLELRFRNDVTCAELARKLLMPKGKGTTEKEITEIIAKGGFYVNYRKIRDPDCVLVPGVHILENGVTVVRVGKRNYFLVKWIFSNDES